MVNKNFSVHSHFNFFPRDFDNFLVSLLMLNDTVCVYVFRSLETHIRCILCVNYFPSKNISSLELENVGS